MSQPVQTAADPAKAQHGGASRISRCFESLRGRREKALIAFVTAGDPNLELTRRMVLAMAEGGADIIELGIPFSDPLLDGPVIQAGSQRALEAGTKVSAIFGLVEALRDDTDVPIIFMTCLNPVLRMGMSTFAQRAAEAGVDGLLITDLPPEEGQEWVRTARVHGLDRVFMLASTSSPERIAAVARDASGFIYCQSRAGVTGFTSDLPADLEDLVGRVKAASPVPIGVGFGISTPEQVRSVVSTADGAAVGTAFVRLVGEHAGDPSGMVKAVFDLTSRLKSATRA